MASSDFSPFVESVEPSPALPQHADVVVIGGGIIGCSAAWFLARGGISVALCEKGRIAGEQSSRNWGFCRQQGRDPKEIPLIQEGLRIWRGLEAEIEADVGFRQAGVLYVAGSRKTMAEYEAWLGHAKQHGLDTRLLSSEETATVMPGASRTWPGAMYTPSDGRAEPSKAAPAIARAAMSQGATIHTGCAVRGIETEAGRVSAVVTEYGVIRTGAVICAGGAWSRLFFGNLGIYLPQLKVMSSVLRTAEAPLVTESGVWAPDFAFRRRQDGGYTVASGSMIVADIVPDSFRLFTTFLPALMMERKGARLRLGRRFLDEMTTTRRWQLDEQTPFEKTRVLDPKPHQSILDDAMANLRSAFPIFENVAVAESWAGLIDVTPDAVPVISAVDGNEGLYLATGFSGHGFGIGPGAGRLIAELVSGADPCVDPTPFRYSRFVDGSKLRPASAI